MQFLWPAFLWGLFLLPLLAVLYVGLLRLRRPPAVRFSNTEIAAAAMERRSQIRRYVAASLFFLALVVIVVSLARPVVSLTLPSDRSGMMLAIDVSGSMLSADVAPTRLEAAKAAAKTFVANLPRRIRIGLVTFAGYAVLHVPPATDHQRVREAINAIAVRHRTAIGDGLMEAVAALPGRVRPRPDGTLPPMDPGPKPPGIVVLLSDGQNNAGLDPLQAAELARRQEVTVYTVGIGQPISPDNRPLIGGPLDEDTLRSIAQRTGGAYYHPASGEELRTIYQKLARSVGWERQPVEVTGLTTTFATGALIAALILSLLIHPLG